MSELFYLHSENKTCNFNDIQLAIAEVVLFQARSAYSEFHVKRYTLMYSQEIKY